MICYRDKTFCGSDCVNLSCGRNFTPEDRERARAWWGGDGAPVAYANFKDRCDEYIAPRTTTSEGNNV